MDQPETSVPEPDLDEPPRGDGRRFLPMALAFEGGLIGVAVIAGWLVGQPPLAHFAYDAAGAVWGVAATAPMLAMLAVTVYAPIAPLRRLRALLDHSILPIFAGWSVWHLATLSLLAGVGEEMLFRGVLQTAVGHWWAPTAGLIVASVVFGLLHALTPTYAVLTTLIGAYLGWLYIWTGNLLAPMIAHGLYDFCALIYLLSATRHETRPAQDD